MKMNLWGGLGGAGASLVWAFVSGLSSLVSIDVDPQVRVTVG